MPPGPLCSWFLSPFPQPGFVPSPLPFPPFPPLPPVPPVPFPPFPPLPPLPPEAGGGVVVGGGDVEGGGVVAGGGETAAWAVGLTTGVGVGVVGVGVVVGGVGVGVGVGVEAGGGFGVVGGVLGFGSETTGATTRTGERRAGPATVRVTTGPAAGRLGRVR